MCGRYVLATSASDLTLILRAESELDISPNWNVTPSQSVPIVRAEARGRRVLSRATWGIEASWSDRGLVINARSESVDDKRLFAPMLSGGRCAIPMTGYYEWRRTNGDGRGTKIPFFIRPRSSSQLDHGGFGVALGLVNPNTMRMVVLTREAPAMIATIHHRMPVFVDEGRLEAWLSESAGPRDIVNPHPVDEDLDWWEVGRAVNSSKSSGAQLIAPVDDGGLFGSSGC